jgi:hypothetical protein
MNLHGEFSSRHKYNSPSTLVIIGGESNGLLSAHVTLSDGLKKTNLFRLQDLLNGRNGISTSLPTPSSSPRKNIFPSE